MKAFRSEEETLWTNTIPAKQIHVWIFKATAQKEPNEWFRTSSQNWHVVNEAGLNQRQRKQCVRGKYPSMSLVWTNKTNAITDLTKNISHAVNGH